MKEMVWCDVCKALHDGESYEQFVFVICPMAPPDMLYWFDPRYVRQQNTESE